MAWIREHAEAYGGPLPKRLDHDGIDDAFVEKASQVFYYEDGAWEGTGWQRLNFEMRLEAVPVCELPNKRMQPADASLLRNVR